MHPSSFFLDKHALHAGGRSRRSRRLPPLHEDAYGFSFPMPGKIIFFFISLVLIPFLLSLKQHFPVMSSTWFVVLDRFTTFAFPAIVVTAYTGFKTDVIIEPDRLRIRRHTLARLRERIIPFEDINEVRFKSGFLSREVAVRLRSSKWVSILDTGFERRGKVEGKVSALREELSRIIEK